MREGACLCGAVRWRSGEPEEVNTCHCRLCAALTSGAPVFAKAARDGFDVAGEVAWRESSPGVRRGWCPGCGTYLFWERAAGPWRWAGVGTMADASGLPEARDICRDGVVGTPAPDA